MHLEKKQSSQQNSTEFSASFTWDQYQLAFLQYDPAPAELILLQAGPGTGKTTIILEYISRKLRNNWVYLVYNVSARYDAFSRFSARIAKEEQLDQEIPIYTFHSYIWKLVSRVYPQIKLVPTTNLVKIGPNTATTPETIPDGEKNKELILTYDDLLSFYSEHFEEFVPYITNEIFFIDEMQDLSTIQLDIVKKWLALNKTVFLVGDIYQSIYGFRGVDFGSILDLQHQANIKFMLKRNFRSFPPIIQVFNRLVPEEYYLNSATKQNQEVTQSYRSEGSVVMSEFATQKQEASYISNFIYDVVIGQDTGAGFRKDFSVLKKYFPDETASWRDFAVIARTNKSLEPIKQEFRKLGIPFKELGKVSGVLEVLEKLISIYYLFFANIQRKITYEEFIRLLENFCLYAKEVLASGIKDNEYRDFLQERLTSENKTISALEVSLVSTSERAGLEDREKDDLASFCPEWYRLQDFLRYYTSSPVVTRGREKTIYHKQQVPKSLGIADWLRALNEFISLYKSGFFYRDVDMVTVGTIHSSKGLEFNYVFLIDVTKGRFPAPYAADLEEEKRLLYVALSRPKQFLYISYVQRPSPLLKQIESEVVKIDSKIKTKGKKKEQLSLL